MRGNAFLHMPPVSTDVGFVGVYLSRMANIHERLLCLSVVVSGFTPSGFCFGVPLNGTVCGSERDGPFLLSRLAICGGSPSWRHLSVNPGLVQPSLAGERG